MREAAARLKRDWELVTQPQGSEPYFTREPGAVPAFDPAAVDYSPANAWFLCELSRLVYLPSATEAGDDALARVRSKYLEAAGLRETASFNRRSNHAAIFESDACGGFTLVCFRGTTSAKQWLLNLTTIPVPWSEGRYVHQGFKYLFDEIGPQVLERLASAQRPVFMTGHSLGGALATLAAATFAPVALYTFGAPRVGNTAFCELLEGVPVFRVVNRLDIVTLLPHAVETLAPYDFHHCGELHYMSEDNEMLVDPKREEMPKENKEIEKLPLTFLAKSFTSPHPPGCLVDHAPSEYLAQLERWV